MIGRRALLAIFTLSGFSGLIYESIWSHYFKLFLGHAAYAQSLVLTVFMGGMALGAWLASRTMPRLRNLLLAYAVVEALTGAIAMGFHPLYLGVVGFTFDTAIPALDSPATINAVKWSIAALLILPQSILLGSTFPFISGGLVRRYPDSSGANLAMLYFTNSFGAALGVLASGFFLIGKIGLPGTVMLAGIINIALAGVVWMLRGPEPPAPPPSGPARTDGAMSAASNLTGRILAVAFLSGAAAFIYEIAWIRMLSLVLGSSTHAFELMLSAFILGLAFGGLWIRRHIDSLRSPLASLALMFALMALLATLTLPAYGFTFDIIGAAVRRFEPTDVGYLGFNLVSHGIAAAIMIPTTFIAGMTLPVMTNTLLCYSGERAIGRVYACNTMGAIAGVLIAVHLLLPGIGVKGAVITGAVFQLLIVLLLLPRVLMAGPERLPKAVLVAAGVGVLLIGSFLQLDPMRMASGVYRRGTARLPDGINILHLRDGKTATISLAKRGDTVTIATNGKPDASLNMAADGVPRPDEITMTLAAALPLAMHADPRQIANIGIGSGLTSHVILGSDRVERLDSIEIEPAMAEAAKLGYGKRVSRLFEDERSHIHYEDAKTFFSAAKRKYDVIISEPSNPWVSGVATLFSDEFYAQITRHLNEGGLLVQWIQIYETDITIVASVFKALSPHFADYQVYSTDDANILIVASASGPLPALDARVFDSTMLAAEMRTVGLNTLGDIEVRRIGGKRLLDPLMATYGVPMNSDFFPFVDINAPRMRFLNRNALDLVKLAYLPVPLAEITGQPYLYTPSDSPSSARYFRRHRLAMEARAIIGAVATQDMSQVPAEVREWVALIASDAKACGAESERWKWLNAVHALASRTTAFLPAAEGTALWEFIRAAECSTTLAPRELAWLQLLQAIATRETVEIASRGAQLFDDPPQNLSGNQAVEALIATTSAQIALGQNAQARKLLGLYLPMLQDARQYTLALRLIASLAQLGPP